MSVKLKALAADSDDANISVCGPRLTPIVDVWGQIKSKRWGSFSRITL